MHSLRHENVNALIGCFCHPNSPALIYDYCSRGSLYEIIHRTDLPLDWQFRYSMLLDLVRVRTAELGSVQKLLSHA